MLTFNRRETHELAQIERAHAAGVGVLVKKPLASGHDADPCGAIRFALSPEGVSSAVVGTSRAEHLIENACAVAGS